MLVEVRQFTMSGAWVHSGGGTVSRLGIGPRCEVRQRGGYELWTRWRFRLAQNTGVVESRCPALTCIDSIVDEIVRYGNP